MEDFREDDAEWPVPNFFQRIMDGIANIWKALFPEPTDHTWDSKTSSGDGGSGTGG